MLLTEWDTEEAKEVWFEEGRNEGRVEGRNEGRVEGREEERAEIAKNALLKGLPFDMIRDITGFDLERIKTISATL